VSRAPVVDIVPVSVRRVTAGGEGGIVSDEIDPTVRRHFEDGYAQRLAHLDPLVSQIEAALDELIWFEDAIEYAFPHRDNVHAELGADPLWDRLGDLGIWPRA
jgi:hypothetical protein